MGTKEVLETSLYQERFWLEWKIYPDSLAYHICVVFSLTGKLNKKIFQRALDETINVYAEGCRTYFCEEKQRISQYVLKQLNVSLIQKNISNSPEERKEKLIDQFIHDISTKIFDLQKPPLFRIGLLTESVGRYRLIFNFHHMILDGISIGIFYQFLADLYNHYVSRRVLPPKPELLFKKYLQFEKRSYSKKAQREDLNYWVEYLRDKPLRLDLSFKKSVELDSSELGFFSFQLMPSEHERLIRWAHQQKRSLFAVLSTVYGILLSRYTGEKQIPWTYPVNMRPSGFERLTGCLVNNLPMVFEYDDQLSFSELVTVLVQQRQEAKKHRFCSFTDIVSAVRKKRAVGGEHLFNVSFAETILYNSFSLQGLQVKQLLMTPRELLYDLYLGYQVLETVHFRLDYKKNRFDDRVLSDFAAEFKQILSDCLETSDRPLQSVVRLTKAERQKILINWNQTYQPFPDDKTMMQWFEEQVRRTPHAIALVFDQQTMTYAEFNARANQIAYAIQLYQQNFQVDPGNYFIGLCIERSFELMIGLYGILKAGAAYLPLDPDYPSDRLAFMAQDAKLNVILTQENFLKKHPVLAEANRQMICFDRDIEWIEKQSTHNPMIAKDPVQAIYVLYTSGSTGNPKGVILEHRGIVNRIDWMQKKYRLTPKDKVLQKTPFTFDVAGWEFFWPLVVGAQLVIAKPQGHKDPRYLIETIKRENITTIHFVPAMFQVFLEEQGVSRLRSLKRVFCSGEGLPTRLGTTLFKRLPRCELHNLYGPTEASIDVSYWQCAKTDEIEFITAPIGKPINNIQLYILDKDKKPVPVAVAGELHIGGVGLARAYLNRPELTAQQFIQVFIDPMKQPIRLYKTGDLARYLPDGNIEFLGRIDHQIKIRGLRVELGEIEAVLEHYAGISQVVVIAKTIANQQQLFVYYTVSDVSTTLSQQALRDYLNTRLPDYMIPHAFVALNDFPMTSSGKINRLALFMRSDDMYHKTRYVAPKTTIEKMLAILWQRIFNKKRIGVQDNFFSLGGDSLIAVRLVTAAAKKGIPISVNQLLANPTVYQLAQEIERPAQEGNKIKSGPPFYLIDLPRHAREKILMPHNVDVYALSQMQQFMLSHYEQDKARVGIYHFQQVFLIQDPCFDEVLFKQALAYVIAKHPLLRTVIRYWARVPVQVVKKNVDVPWTVVDIQGAVETESKPLLRFMVQERKKSFQIKDDALLYRFYLLRFSDRRLALMISFHHAVLDGWSKTQLLAEIVKAYETIRQNKPIRRKIVPNVYKAFIAYERKSLTSREQKFFWRQYLIEAKLYGPRFNREAEHNKIKYESIEILPIQIKQLLHQAKKENISLKALLLGIFLHALAALCQQKKIIVGVLMNGRTEQLADPFGALGLFWNLVPFLHQAPLGGRIDFQQVQHALTKIEEHEIYPLPQILKVARAQRLFDVTFNYTHFHHAEKKMKQQKIRLKNLQAFDAYHFPINFAVHYSAVENSMEVRVHYDVGIISSTRVQRLLQNFFLFFDDMVK